MASRISTVPTIVKHVILAPFQALKIIMDFCETFYLTLLQIPGALSSAYAETAKFIADARDIYEKSPSVYLKSPKEHILECRYKRNRNRPCPPGHIRVVFYSRYKKFLIGRRDELDADVPVSRGGDLPLGSIKQMWGLESCSIIDPMRFSVFEPGEPGYLSAVAVKVLTEHGQLIVFEPPVSQLTHYKRAFRICVVPKYEKAFRIVERIHTFIAPQVQGVLTFLARQIILGQKYLARQIGAICAPYFARLTDYTSRQHVRACSKLKSLRIFWWDFKEIFLTPSKTTNPLEEILCWLCLFFFSLFGFCWYFNI